MQGIQHINPARHDLVDPLLQRLYDYWDEKRRARAMPSRADIDSLEMGFILGYVSLVDVLYAPLRFGIRVHGTELACRLGYDLTGKTLDALPIPEFRTMAQQSFATTVHPA
jgi:hypothetical protein